MLINLDLAKEQDSKPSGARNQTGMIQFMAVEVLRGVDYTYQYDLESFFYMFLWLCVCCAWDKLKGFCEDSEMVSEESDLYNWEIRSFKEIMKVKEGDMTMNGLEYIINEFPKLLSLVKQLYL